MKKGEGIERRISTKKRTGEEEDKEELRRGSETREQGRGRVKQGSERREK